MQKILLFIFFSAFLCINAQTQKPAAFNGVEVNLSNLFRLSSAKSRSISPENLTGEPGKGGMTTIAAGTAKENARDLGQGWKVNPYINIEVGQTATLAEINGPGAIQHIWMTPTGNWRFSILRFYWDDESSPSIEVPVGDSQLYGARNAAPAFSYSRCSSGLVIRSHSGWVSFFRDTEKECGLQIAHASSQGRRWGSRV